MTEKEKMLAQKLYDANYDEELLAKRDKCHDMCHEFNQVKPSDRKKQRAVLLKIFGKAKGDFCIESDFWCDYGWQIEIGDKFYANRGLVILDEAKVCFGDNVFIGPKCGFYTAGHPVDAKRRNKGLEYAYPITVGDNVWFGANVSVMPGITIGNNAVIGAGSVVVKDIPENVIAAGNPCKVIRAITDRDGEKNYDRG